MSELARPFVRAWEWIGRVGGFPGQVFFVIAVIMLLILFFTWLSNRR